MTETPQLVTDRLRLRAFGPDDAAQMFAILGGRDVLRYFPTSEPISLAKVETFITSVVDHWESNGFGLWAVETLEASVLIGRCGLQHLPETDEVEIDFIMAPDVWGRGFATEAATASLHFGFDRLGLTRIVGLVHPENGASRKVLENIGMTFDIRADYFDMTVDRYGAEPS